MKSERAKYKTNLLGDLLAHLPSHRVALLSRHLGKYLNPSSYLICHVHAIIKILNNEFSLEKRESKKAMFTVKQFSRGILVHCCFSTYKCCQQLKSKVNF